jgi:tetratricopeptide (TPR) repeat protein
MIEKFPDHAAPLWELVHLFIKEREFDSSRHYLELYSQDDTTDHLKWSNYHIQRASLAMWRGQFLEATTHLHNRVAATIKSEDKDQIESAYRSLASHFYRLRMMDSVSHYLHATTGNDAQIFQEISYPLMMIRLLYDDGATLKNHFDSLEIEMRGQLPKGMWVIVDALKDIYYGFYELDSLRALRGYQALNADRRYRSSGNIIQAGALEIKLQMYSEALETLSPLLEGELDQTNGYGAPLLRYLVGRAHEGVGNNQKAVEFYQEVLKYWGDPDYEIKQIKETRERLATLTS